MNPGLTKNYIAEGVVNGGRIVKAGSADGKAAQAAAVSDKVIGVSDYAVGPFADGERMDVYHEGIADLVLGGNVAYGDFLTSNASGQGVAAAPAAGTNNQIIGKALASGVSGDVIPVLINICMLQG